LSVSATASIVSTARGGAEREGGSPAQEGVLIEETHHQITSPPWPALKDATRLERLRLRRDPLLRRMVGVADVGTAAIAGSVLAIGADAPGAAAAIVVVVVLWVVVAKVGGLYDRDHRALRHRTVDEIPALAFCSLISVVVASGVLDLLGWHEAANGPALTAAVVALVAGGLLRALARCLFRLLVPPERTLIVGSGPLADAARRKFELFPDIHVAVVGEQAVGAPHDLSPVLSAMPSLDRIVVAAQTIDEALISQLVGACRRERVKLSVIPPARGMFGTAVQLNHIADLPVVEYNTWDISRSTVLLKRIVDISVSLVALAALAPLLAAVALAVKLDSRGSILYIQRRAGKGGRPFALIKFRTMVPDAERLLDALVRLDELPEPAFKVADDPRVTRVGRLLRRWSVDELPQLFNVLRGDMSLVGPRPEQVDLVRRYAPQHLFRLSVRPGVTGPMQVYGRGALSFEERLAVEREYVENLSLARDLRILWLTLGAVISGRGAT